MKRPSEILERIAHFLCINSEALPSNGLDGKMPLLYFLFVYGKRFEKQPYSDFAFEILHECISAELRKLKSPEGHMIDFDLTSLELGWSLQKFIEMGFLKSDELDEILIPFDTMAVRRAARSISNTPSKSTLNEYLFLATYLNDRISAIELNIAEIDTAQEYLTKIKNSIANFLDKNDEENLEVVGAFEFLHYQKGNKIQKKNFRKEKEILERFEKAREVNDLDTLLLLYVCLPEKFKADVHAAKLFWVALNKATQAAMESIYVNDKANPFAQLMAVQKYGCAMLKKRGVIHRQFLVNVVLKKLHDSH